ncbi:sensor histidine kinase [Clostridium beijerinckii]|uniref:histidine kinase n=1 Tax=Clostridium beijerinckii TaxID=1520 RepID=A0A1S9NAK9_CLOBE|nr:HAMP domain-containing sensor histidine kinase [Clostridium beijerinckii]OOP74586.1 two-component sensor histidine kinase [Clostridium beijerinckii]
MKKALKTIKNAKISIKLTILYAFMFSLVLLILNASILYGVKYHLYNQANKEIQDTQNVMLNTIVSKNQQLDLSNEEIFSDIPHNENIDIRIIQEDGTILNSSGSFDYKIKNHHDKTDILEDIISTAEEKAIHLEEKGKELLYKKVEFESNKYGNVYIEIIKNMDNEYYFLEVLFGFMAIADFIGMISSLLLGYIVSKRMLKPISYITKAAENISINNLKERINGTDSDDELNRLINTFNTMIDRLQESFDRQVQFVSDASHELRTPITVIQGYANLLDRWGKDDREALEKSIYAIKLEAGNMASLVEKLLFLAKGDSGTQVIEKKEFYLNELVDEVVLESRLIAPRHIITNNKNNIVNITADYKMIKQMLRIFIDNSIKFTTEENKIDVSLEAQEEFIKLTVSDTGIGIPKDEIENIFHRFYIVDKSRSKEKGGTGLGLSIAKWIVYMHKGNITVESEEGKGTKVTVTLSIEQLVTKK